ncbi:Ribonuclease_H [Hexamita inflata]|uniref:ribonuclease H n=1 Tax=Hexamita inflata TaxID=28002 RepID=A0AA86TMW6_9EUKA|nr:Ribonuclease H [Hexamita inflata]
MQPIYATTIDGINCIYSGFKWDVIFPLVQGKKCFYKKFPTVKEAQQHFGGKSVEIKTNTDSSTAQQVKEFKTFKLTPGTILFQSLKINQSVYERAVQKFPMLKIRQIFQLPEEFNLEVVLFNVQQQVLSQKIMNLYQRVKQITQEERTLSQYTNYTTLYVDGGATPSSGGPGGFAVVKPVDHSQIEVETTIAYGYSKTTNNRMELLAFLVALLNFKGDLLICADSMYVINTYTQWIVSWVTKGKGSLAKFFTNGVNNQDIIGITLLQLLQSSRSIAFCHVKGHSGIHFNEMADVGCSALIGDGPDFMLK